MRIEERLRLLANALPAGGAVTLTRSDLVALLEDGGDVSKLDTRDLSVEDVAEETGRAPSTVRGWLIAGALKGYKLNRRDWRVPPAELRAYLERQAAPPVPPCPPENVDIGAWRRVSGEAA